MAYGTASGYAPPPYMPAPRDPTDVMGKRVVAYLIDIVLAGAILVALLAATKDRTYIDIPSSIDDACRFIRNQDDFSGQCLQLGDRAYTWTGGAVALSWGLSALVGLLNNVILQTATGASVGKMIMGLRVVGADGQTAGLGRQFGRWLTLLVDAGLCFIGLFIALFTHPHRRLGDMVATTYVVATADAGRPLDFAPASQQYGQAFGQPPGQQYGQPAYVPPAPAAAWPQPQPQAGGWNQAPQPQPPYQWGAQEQPPVPQPTRPQWGEQAQPHIPQQPPQWGAQAQPHGPEQTPQPWGAPAPQQPAAPQWESPQPSSPPAPEAAPPEAQPPAPTPDPPTKDAGESWWDRAVSTDDRDDEPTP